MMAEKKKADKEKQKQQEEAARTQNIHKILKNRHFWRSVRNIPDSHVRYIKWLHMIYDCPTVMPLVAESKTAADDKEEEDWLIRKSLALIRWTWRSCAQCHRATHPKLMMCGACRLEWYCDQTCQDAHWSKHQTICGKQRHLPFDPKDPSAPNFVYADDPHFPRPRELMNQFMRWEGKK